MRKVYYIIAVFYLSLSLIFTPMTGTRAQEEKDKEFKEDMKCEDKDITTDEEWQWYKIEVELLEDIVVTLEYEGDLDLDLRLYWLRDNVKKVPNFYGFDLTHCDVNSKDYNYSDYSQFRTEDTDDIGEPEELEFSNPSYSKDEDQIAFILVYVHSGEGKSEYTLEANKEITRIQDDDVYDCNSIIIVLITYFSLSLAIFLLYVLLVIRKKRKIVKPLKEEEKRLAHVKKGEPKKLKTIDLDSKLEE